VSADPTPSATSSVEGPTVLFISSNGTGMGHLTRLMAMARRRAPGTRAVFASLSQAVPVVAAEGFDWEYLPSREVLGIGARRWNLHMAHRFAEILDRERPDVVVFDGTYPYDALLTAARARPSVRLVWSRRGMWRQRASGSQLALSRHFDLIIEPGELAAEEDRGATVGRTDAYRVAPITLLSEDDLLPREEAAHALGLAPDRPAVLVSLGAGNLRDHGADLDVILDRLAEEPDLQIVVTRAAISERLAPVSDRVHAVSVYPVSRYLRAIDFAVAAVGYNSFHEFVGFAVPTLFVPNPAMPLDDQPARSRWAQRAGAAVDVPDVTVEAVDAAVTLLADPARREALARTCRAASRGNGAGAAMAAIEELAAGRAPVTGADGSPAPVPAPGPAAGARIRFGARRLVGRAVDRIVRIAPVSPPGLRVGPARRTGPEPEEPVLVQLVGVGGDAFAARVADLAALLDRTSGLGVVLLTDTPDFGPARRAGLPVEHVISPQDWARRYPDRPWAGHLELRLRQVRDLYRARHVVDAAAHPDDLPVAVLRAAPTVGPLAPLVRPVRALLRRLDPPTPVRP
jgi:UDP:flavonoid glycosyltransferase YjiC (YdhE family)